ncbi:MAG: ABC transporter permease subunit, partial [Candidatus Saccharibacteria bacterium]
YLFTFVTLAGAIQAMNLGVGIISREYSGKTADFLLAKPVGRSSVITQKLLATVVLLLITNVIFTVAAFTTALVVSTKSFDVTTFFLIASTLFLIQLAFLTLGALLSVVITKIRSVIAVTLPTIFAFFIIGSIGAIVGTDTVKYLTPFKFYDPAYIVQNNDYEMKFVIVELVFVILAVTATYVLFNKKDVRSAT